MGRGRGAGNFGGGQMQQMMMQAQKMQKEMEKKQDELAQRNYEASSGGGMVKAIVNGKQEIIDLQINPDALEGGDAEIVQDMVKAAVNEAIKISHETAEKEMGTITGGGGIPGLF